MKQSFEIFYAKILLFGEYSVIRGSKGLTVPYTHFTGELSFVNDDKYTDLNFAINSNEQMRSYLQYLQKLYRDKELLCNFEISEFERDLEQGLYYESSIPQGYGVGSSGALCAALYRNYVQDVNHRRLNIEPTRILELKQIFAQLESFFHGTSSGLDPLNCYIKQPLLIEHKDYIHTVQIPRAKFKSNSAIFLLDTKMTGKTEPLVNIFMERCLESSYGKMIEEEYIPTNNMCINKLIEGAADEFFVNLQTLSALQLEYLTPMIPTVFHSLWKSGLRTEKYLLKLCGSGGGGFLLGFTNNWHEIQHEFANMNLEIIPVYKQA